MAQRAFDFIRQCNSHVYALNRQDLHGVQTKAEVADFAPRVGVRMYVRRMQAAAVWEAVGRLRADYEAFAALPIDLLTRSQVLAVWDEFEAFACQMPTQRHRLLARLQAET